LQQTINFGVLREKKLDLLKLGYSVLVFFFPIEVQPFSIESIERAQFVFGARGFHIFLDRI